MKTVLLFSGRPFNFWVRYELMNDESKKYKLIFAVDLINDVHCACVNIQPNYGTFHCAWSDINMASFFKFRWETTTKKNNFYYSST